MSEEAELQARIAALSGNNKVEDALDAQLLTYATQVASINRSNQVMSRHHMATMEAIARPQTDGLRTRHLSQPTPGVVATTSHRIQPTAISRLW